MAHIINIHNKDYQINLEIGTYKVDVLGGWGVTRGQFSISFSHTQSGQVIRCKRVLWPAQTFAFGKRAKRIFTFSIPQRGTYNVAFTDSETLTVKASGLFFPSRFQEPIPNETLSVYIH